MHAATRPTLYGSYTPRAAYGDALCALGIQNSALIVLDAEVKNSTTQSGLSSIFRERFYQSYYRGTELIGMAVGLASCGAIPFAYTFGAFITRPMISSVWQR